MTKLAIILFVLFVSNAMAGPLVTVIGRNVSPPWLVYGKKGELGGINVEYLRLIEKKLKKPIDIQVLPKARIRLGFESGEIDFNCFTSPVWAGADSKNFLWSEPLFPVKSILVTNKEPVESLESVYGKRIGTVRKYRYPMLDKLFASGKLIRDDASDEYSNLLKLELNRYNYAVAEITHFKYYLAQNPKSKLKFADVSFSHTDVSCWVRKGSELKLDTLNRVISEMKSDGSLDEIFERYFTKKQN